MTNRNSNRRLTKSEYEEKESLRAQQRTRRWQRIAFALISVMVLASMIVSLFVRF
ncbi:MAG TPA: hypothetical protein VF313_11320 [Anaerolineaceae bacterium]|jgi:hypothetical protein